MAATAAAERGLDVNICPGAQGSQGVWRMFMVWTRSLPRALQLLRLQA